MSAAKRAIFEQMERGAAHCDDCEKLRSECECELRCPGCFGDLIYVGEDSLLLCDDCGYLRGAE